MKFSLRKSLIYLAVCLFQLPFTSYGKGKVDTIFTKDGVDVYIRRNHSNRLKLIAEAHLIDVEPGMSDPIRLSTGVNADFLFPKFVSFNGVFRVTYFSLLKEYAAEKSLSQNHLKSFLLGNAGIRLHIVDGRGEAWHKVILGHYLESNDDGTPHHTTRFLKAKYPCRRIIALRGGLYYSNAPVLAELNGSLLHPLVRGAVKTDDGTVFTSQYYTNSYTGGYYVGLSRILNMKIRVSSNIDTFEGKGKLISFFRETYADVIFANTTFDPFQVKGKEYPITADADGSFRTNKIGWRFGGRLLSTRTPVNMGVSYEIGSRPGVFVRGFYVGMGVTLAYLK